MNDHNELPQPDQNYHLSAGKIHREPKTRQLFFLLALIAIYLAIGARILTESSFHPYITDNVETYSNYIHAKNIYTRGVGESYGLTDETYGNDLASPTVVYTHQGNFPRLYSLAQFALGIDTVSGQILATFLTVGVASVIFAFLFFSKISSISFGVIAVLCLILNYVFFTQWQFDTYRIWHAFFLFFSLWCACKMAESKSGVFPFLCGLSFIFCFYFEIIFAVYLALLFVLFLICISWPHFKRARAGIVSCVAGAIIGAAILVVQDVAYLGWEAFIRDLYYTYVFRNYSGPEYDSQLKLLESFYRENSVLFWYINNQDTRGWLHPKGIIGYHAVYIGMLLPPFLILTTLLAIGALVIRAGYRLLLDGNWIATVAHYARVENLPPFSLVHVPAFIIAALIIPLILLPIITLVASGNFWPLLIFSFVPWSFVAAGILIRPESMLIWLRRSADTEVAAPGTLARLVRMLAVSSLILVLPAALAMIVGGKSGLTTFGFEGLNLPIRLIFVLVASAAGFAFWKADQAGVLLGRLAGYAEQNEGIVTVYASNSASIFLLIGLYGIVSCIGVNTLQSGGLLAIALGIPAALLFAIINYAHFKKRNQLEGGIANRNVENNGELRARLSIAAWIATTPLFLVAFVPAFILGRFSFTTLYIGFMASLMALFAPVFARYLQGELRRFKHEYDLNPVGLNAALRNVSGKATLIFLLILPSVILHKSSDPAVLGRYSAGYFLFVATYVSYAMAALLVYFCVNTKQGIRDRIQNAIELLLKSMGANTRDIYSVFRVWIIGLVLVSSTVYFLIGAWKFLTAIKNGAHIHSGALYGFAVLGALLIVFGITKSTTGRFMDVGRFRTLGVFLAGGFLLFFGRAIGVYVAHLGPVEIETWRNITPAGFPNIFSWILIMPAVYIALDLILRSDYFDRIKIFESGLRNIGILMVCGVGAYAVVLIFAPGYIFSAYLARWAIFPSFLFILAFAIAVHVYFIAARIAMAPLWNDQASRSTAFPETTGTSKQ